MATSCSHIGLWSGYAEQHEPLIWDGYFYVLCLKLRNYTIGPRGVQVEHREKWKWLERKTDEKQRQIVKWGRREKLKQQWGFLTRERLYRLWPVHLLLGNMKTEKINWGWWWKGLYLETAVYISISEWFYCCPIVGAVFCFVVREN